MPSRDSFSQIWTGRILPGRDSFLRFCRGKILPSRDSSGKEKGNEAKSSAYTFNDIPVEAPEEIYDEATHTDSDYEAVSREVKKDNDGGTSHKESAHNTTLTPHLTGSRPHLHSGSNASQDHYDCYLSVSAEASDSHRTASSLETSVYDDTLEDTYEELPEVTKEAVKSHSNTAAPVNGRNKHWNLLKNTKGLGRKMSVELPNLNEKEQAYDNDPVRRQASGESAVVPTLVSEPGLIDNAGESEDVYEQLSDVLPPSPSQKSGMSGSRSVLNLTNFKTAIQDILHGDGQAKDTKDLPGEGDSPTRTRGRFKMGKKVKNVAPLSAPLNATPSENKSFGSSVVIDSIKTDQETEIKPMNTDDEQSDIEPMNTDDEGSVASVAMAYGNDGSRSIDPPRTDDESDYEVPMMNQTPNFSRSPLTSLHMDPLGEDYLDPKEITC